MPEYEYLFHIVQTEEDTRCGQGLDDDIKTVRYTIDHLKATGYDARTYIVRDMERVLRNLEAVQEHGYEYVFCNPEQK